jgi:recombination-promoting nuclease RpnC
MADESLQAFIHPTRDIHDVLAKLTFSDAERARTFLQQVLPKDLVAVADWSTLRPMERQFVDQDLGKTEADLLWSVSACGRDMWFCPLLEHFSQPDADAAFRLLGYMVDHWRALKRNPENKPGGREAAMPVVVPIVLSQGPRAWDAPRSFHEWLGLPSPLHEALHPLVPDFQYIVVELGPEVLDSFRHSRDLFLLLSALRYGREQGIEWMLLQEDALAALLASGRASLFRTLFLYLIRAHRSTKKLEVKTIMDRLTRMDVATESKSLMDLLLEEGIEKGMVKGIEKGIEKGI